MASGQERAQRSAQAVKTVSGAQARTSLVAELQQVLPRLLDGGPVALAYLYGSVATGLASPFSDLDLALVADEGLSPLERLKLILGLQLDLSECCDIPKVDVRIINDAPLVFRGRVVTDGIAVYVRDERERVEFEVTTRLRYFDYLPVHRRLQEAFFADLRERGLYG